MRQNHQQPVCVEKFSANNALISPLPLIASPLNSPSLLHVKQPAANHSRGNICVEYASATRGFRINSFKKTCGAQLSSRLIGSRTCTFARS
jgi:hypothetical protein